MGQQASTGLVLFNSFWSYVRPNPPEAQRNPLIRSPNQVMPMAGAYVADTYWGRYKTISWSIAVALVGHTMLTCSAIPSIIAKPNSAIALFAVAIVVMGIGTGGFKSNISPLIAEQTRNTYLRVETRKNGAKVLVDPALTSARVFMYFYLMINM